MSDPKVGAGKAPIPGPGPGPLPEKPIVGTSNAGIGVTGESRTNVGVSGVSTGILIQGSPPSDGVLGVGQNGVHGQSGSPGGNGVLGEHVAGGTGVSGSSVSGTGVSGTSHGASPGVYGSSNGLDGVQGVSTSPQHAGVSGSNNSGGSGVWATSNANHGVYGQSQSPSNSNAGVAGVNTGQGPGVYGSSTALDGVQGVSGAKDHAGVSGVNNSGGSDGMGVYGFSSGSDGVRGISATKDHAGLSGHNDSGGYGIWASGTPAGYFNGDIQVTGDVTLINSDCAEDFDISCGEDVEPGTVMVIKEGEVLQMSQSAYDKRVAGVISGVADLKPGIVLGKRPSLNKRMPLALLGKVYCKVDAGYSPIEVGDLLTTSPTPGHAMKAVDPTHAFGATIGKALQPLGTGQGLIPILIALQ